MSDWAIGDLAVCVDSPGYRLVNGNVYRVRFVGFTSLSRTLALGFNGDAKPEWYAYRFRKIRPDEHEKCEPEFVTLLKRSRKTVRA